MTVRDTATGGEERRGEREQREEEERRRQRVCLSDRCLGSVGAMSRRCLVIARIINHPPY
jgi:hypothetical protein